MIQGDKIPSKRLIRIRTFSSYKKEMAIAKLQYIQAELIEQLIHMVKLIPRIKQASNPLTIRGNIQIIITSNNLSYLIENLQTVCQIIISMIPQTDHEHIIYRILQTSRQ